MDFLKKYESFIFKNASQISSIESTLRSLTYILPGKQQGFSLYLYVSSMLFVTSFYIVSCADLVRYGNAPLFLPIFPLSCSRSLVPLFLF
jgi:hypothetical protein